MMNACLSLWAVHISDGLLVPSWLIGGGVLAALLVLGGAFRLREEEVPQIALLAAAFFVTSQLHVRVGPSSAHLLLNGLIGVILGRRAVLAILVGLALQAILFGHGSLVTLGVNTCVMALPALIVGQLFVLLHQRSWVRRRWFCAGLVAVSSLLWTLSLVFSVMLAWSNKLTAPRLDPGVAVEVTFHPLTFAAAALLAGVAVLAERRMENAPEFALGLLLGEAAVLLTLLLHTIALLGGGEENWQAAALFLFIVHLPVAAIEGVVLGFAVSFLARVKPELLGVRHEPNL
jgi:cobalt/nickel transport system permease protein